ncbi:MAG: rhamnan synthesis F family protein [Ruthenibacterium sp.]
MMPLLTRLIIVCNGTLSEEGRQTFSQFTNEIIVRENEGLDAGAYKCAIDAYGWDELEKYDEVVLFNHTTFGPVYPFSEMFDAMGEKDVDFWGITMHYGSDFDPFGTSPYGYLPPHLQSSFHVYRKKFVQSKELQDYWNNLPEIHTYADSVGKHESFFTQHFQDLGFRWACYTDTEYFKEYADLPSMIYPKRLVEELRCPVFKRRLFSQNYDYYLHYTAGQPAMELYEFLKTETDFDLNLIWDNVLRTMNQTDFARNLQLQYMLSDTLRLDAKAQPVLKQHKVALVMHLYFMDLLDDSYRRVSVMPPEIDVYITTNTAEKKLQIEARFSTFPCHSLTVLLIENRGRDVSSLLVGFAPYVEQYDYVCFVHDKKTVQNKPASVGESFGMLCWDNVLQSNEYVHNVLSTFEDNPRLGILVPPVPLFGPTFPILHWKGWKPNFSVSQKLAKDLGFTVPIAEDKMPVAPYGTMFWFRTKALEPLYRHHWKYEDFPVEPNGLDGTILHAIERLYPIAAQQAGYYPGTVMSACQAAIQHSNLELYVQELSKNIFRFVSYSDINGTENQFNQLVPHILEAEATGDYERVYNWNKSPVQANMQYEKSFWRKLRNRLQKLLPNGLYEKIMKLKRKLFGPHDTDNE